MLLKKEMDFQQNCDFCILSLCFHKSLLNSRLCFLFFRCLSNPLGQTILLKISMA